MRIAPELSDSMAGELRAVFMKYQTCALCGLSLGPEPSCIHVATGKPIHVECLGADNVMELE